VVVAVVVTAGRLHLAAAAVVATAAVVVARPHMAVAVGTALPMERPTLVAPRDGAGTAMMTGVVVATTIAGEAATTAATTVVASDYSLLKTSV
jgi:hypothetical protein